jgi:signal transduction histidine kinase/DNA-binding NarL/FixJ family response regulator
MTRSLIIFLCCSLNVVCARQISTTLLNDRIITQLGQASTDTTAINIYLQLAEQSINDNPNQALLFADSALATARQLQNTEYIAKTLIKLGSYHRRLSYFQKSAAFLEEAIRISPQTSAWLGEIYLESGITFLRMSNLDSATTYITLGLEHFAKYPDPTLEALCLNMMGNIKREQNAYEAALDYYIKALRLFEQEQDLAGLTQSLSNIGNIHNLLGDTEKALDYALQSLEKAQLANAKSSIAYSNRLLGRIYRKKGKPDEALNAYKSAIEMYDQLGSKRDLCETLLSIANIYYDKGEFTGAIRRYQEAIAIAKTIPDTLSMSYCYLSGAQTLMQLKQLNRAKAYLDTAITLSERKQILVVTMDAHALLSEIYETEGSYKLSKEHLATYMTIRDSVTQMQNKKAAQEIEARYQSEKKDDAIRILNAENGLKAAQIRSKNREQTYLLIFLALTIALAGIIYNRYKLKARANIKLKELDEMKSRFFTNVSHEFRTPLSLIIGPLEKVLTQTADGPEKENFEMMYRNADRLQNLINQVLDLSKLEAGSMELQLEEGEISAVIRLISSTFSSMAQRKNLTYTQEIFQGPLNGVYDRDKLEKMLNNLLSNAFKFTPEGGVVSLKATEEDGKISIEVTDTGIGISEKELPLIFNRFYQIDDSNTRSSEGSGIGLALTKELAELHRGKLSVTSREGIGSVFTLVIPIRRDAYPELPIQHGRLEKRVFAETPLSQSTVVNNLDDESKPLILVAEDNEDMRSFMMSLLRETYRVVCTTNGKEALECAKSIVPDLIITDWMMPVMDGIACCEQIKITQATSHIPVLMLTARADQSSKLEGLETGADDYLIKPFNATELIIRISNLIEQRRKLREIFSRELILQPSQILLPSRDATFLTGLLALLEKKYSDPDFSVEGMSDYGNMSRMQLHRKLKALTDQSPGEFLRRFRLERAKQLLLVNGMQVSEVCFKVGFNNLSHFSKAFKDFTGTTPTEFSEASKEKSKML